MTCIVGIRTPSDIVLGADSKGILGNGQTSHEYVCKIVRVDDFFFANSGLLEHVGEGFSVQLIGQQAFEKSAVFVDIIRAFERMLIKSLTTTLERIARDFPVSYERYFEGQAAVAALFFGIQNDTLLFSVRDFKPTRAASDSISIDILRKDCPGPDCPTGIATAFLGQHDAIDTFLKGNPSFWRIGLIDAVRSLVELEILEKPDDVGPPIDMVHINRAGVHWIQKKPECTDTRRA